MKYYIIAGEASGDIYGANLISAINKRDKMAKFRCWGGDLIKAEVGELAMHYEKISFMGIYQVIINIFTIMNMFRFCKRDIKLFNPDVCIFIDYPGFNLRMAKYVKKKYRAKVFYYISPQVWIWKSSRVKVVREYVDKMFVILPFEKDYYKSKGVDVDFVGHPLIDVIAKFKKDNLDKVKRNSGSKPILLIMPGSRRGEIKNILPTMLSAVEHLVKDYKIIIVGKAYLKSLYEQLLGKSAIKNDVRIVYDKPYELMMKGDLSLVSSGTATLENALFYVPQLVCYRIDIFSYIIARLFFNPKRVSLVNIIMKEDFIKELIQHNMTKKNIKKHLDEMINNQEKIDKILSKYKSLEHKLKVNDVSDNLADRIIKYS